MPELAQPGALQVLARLERDEAGRSAVDLAGYLRRQGWRAFVASAGGSLTRDLAVAGATHLPLPLDGAGRWSAWRNAGRLRRAVREHRIALIHAHAPGPAWSAMRAARVTGAGFLATCHALEPAPDAAGRRHREALLAGERLIAVSEYLAGELTRELPADPQRLRTVRRWIDLREFDPERVRGHRVAGLAERCGIAVGTTIVAVPGGLQPGGGHLGLIEAVALAERRDFELLFLGAADGGSAYVREVLARLRATRLDGRARFAGEVADLPAALALADLVVLPATRPDPSGMVALAAQAMGRPVIVTDQGALADSILPAATGWLVPSGDAAELARALDLALSLDGEVRARLAARARAFVADSSALEAMCARTLGVYRELLRPAGQPRAVAGGAATGGAPSGCPG